MQAHTNDDDRILINFIFAKSLFRCYKVEHDNFQLEPSVVQGSHLYTVQPKNLTEKCMDTTRLPIFEHS